MREEEQPKALAPRAFSSFVFLGLVSFTSVDIVYQRW
jgi:hypothetical protein